MATIGSDGVMATIGSTVQTIRNRKALLEDPFGDKVVIPPALTPEEQAKKKAEEDAKKKKKGWW